MRTVQIHRVKRFYATGRASRQEALCYWDRAVERLHGAVKQGPSTKEGERGLSSLFTFVLITSIVLCLSRVTFYISRLCQ